MVIKMNKKPTLPDYIVDVSHNYVGKDIRLTQEPHLPKDLNRGEQAMQRFGDIVEKTSGDSKFEF